MGIEALEKPVSKKLADNISINIKMSGVDVFFMFFSLDVFSFFSVFSFFLFI